MTPPLTRLLCRMTLTGLALILPVVPGAAQEMALAASQAPKFLIPAPTPDAAPVEVDVSRVASLRRRISLDLKGVRLGDALAKIAEQAEVKLVYLRSALPLDSLVRFQSNGITVAATLTELLIGLRVDVMVSSMNQLALVPSATQRAAPGSITGRVIDAQSKEGIEAADVSLMDTPHRAVTSGRGTFHFPEISPGSYTLLVRRIGYGSSRQQVAVSDGEAVQLLVVLTQQATRLDEVVTTVTGDQRRLEVGNSIVSLNADSLMQTAPVMTFGDLLQGRSPGVLSLSTNGNTGQSGRIRIRGLNSFGVPNDPIVIMDGVRVEAGAGTRTARATSSGAGGYSGRLADLDPDEIASIEVVKGPSATTLYGTDAANGVIVVTTKRGQAGKSRWTIFTEQGLLQQRLDFTDTYVDGYYAFGRSTTDNTPQRCTLVLRAEGGCVADSLASFNTFDDPATRPFKDAHRQQYGVQLSGGMAGGATYFLSGDYEQETGTAFMPELDQTLIRTTQARTVPEWQVRPNAYERLNLRTNLAAPLGQRGDVTLAAGFVSNRARQPGFSPLVGQVGYRDENDGWDNFGDCCLFRPAYIFARRGEDVVQRFTGSLTATYGVRDWLMLRGMAGVDLSTNAYGQMERRGEGIFVGSLAFLNSGTRHAHALSIARYSLDVGATATRIFSAVWSSKTSVGVQFNRRAQRGMSTFATDLPLGGETIEGAASVTSSEATLTTAVGGGYFEEVLGFKDRLFLTGALRLDGSSAFGEALSVAIYPKASLSWVVSNAQVGPRLLGVSALRLRAAYGASGVQPGPLDALARVVVQDGTTVDGTARGPTGVLVGGNPNLKPERTEELEAGLDLELWKSRVRLEFTAYQRTTRDGLVSRPNGPDVGGSTIENLGSVRNRGLELLLSADLLQGRVLAAGFTATGSLNENRLRRLGEGVLVSSPMDEGTRQEVGYPLYGVWGFVAEDYSDTNGNGILEPSEIAFSTVSRYMGPGFPTREATLSPYVKLGGGPVRLSGLVQYRGGSYAPNWAAFSACVAFSCRAANDPGTPLAEQARSIGSLSFTQGLFTESESYIFLRELSMALTVPASVARVLGAEAGNVVLAGRNLALLWKASDLPFESNEVSADAGGVETNSGIPGPSTYWLLRVNLTY